MLIRVRGGKAGVFDYLRDGKKSGRMFTRDQLDERVVLAGHMGVAESVVNAMSNRGEKYLHITLSFKEDHLPLETLRSITEEFEAFCMRAYRVDEYAFYAEAHLPKIKTYTNQKTGFLVTRKPHIHIVIPELNLLSHKHLNPLGKVDHQEIFLEAFQEHINAKYGLASPKDNRRVRITDESTVITQKRGSQFEGIGSELKEQLLLAMIDRDIVDFDAFQLMAAEFGAVRVRNEGKPNAYLNVRPGESKKGVNLKDYVFSREFVALPASEKMTVLSAAASRRATDAAEYIEPKSSHPSPVEMASRLAEWYEIRARELKYINSGSRNRYEMYRKSEPEEKGALLDQLQAKFYEKYDTKFATGVDLEDVQLDELYLENGDWPTVEPASEAEENLSRAPESIVEQLLVEQVEEIREAKLSTSDEHREIKRTLDASRLLAHLSYTHGVIAEKYQVKKGLDGGDRIQCGSRNLNVADFLTKELHLHWPVAESILREVYAAQRASAVAQPRDEILPHFWETYRRTWPAREEAKEKDWAKQKAAEAERRAQIRAAYMAERVAIRADSTKTPSERKAAYSLASMRKAMESARLYREIDQERRALREKHPKPGREGYKLFLVVLAEDCDAGALAELRRQTQQAKQPTSGNRLGAERESDPSKPVLLPSVSYRVDQRGNVTYYADPTRTKPILVDTGRQVEVVDLALDTVETGLRLALQKFGPALDVHGSPAFKAAVLGVVMRTGLRVEFKDPALATELERLRGASSQLAQVPKVMPITPKTEQEIEADYAGEVYEGELGRGDAQEPGTGLWQSDIHTAVPSPSEEPPRLR